MVPRPLHQPSEQCLPKSLRSSISGSDEVIHIENPPVRQILDDPVSGHGPGLAVTFQKGEEITTADLAPYRRDEIGADKMRPQLPHDIETGFDVIVGFGDA